MGYTIEVSRREAERAVKRGIAEIIKVKDSREVAEYSEYGDYLGSRTEPEEHIFRTKDGLVSMGDWGFDYFWSHGSSCGSLITELSTGLWKNKIKFRSDCPWIKEAT